MTWCNDTVDEKIEVLVEEKRKRLDEQMGPSKKHGMREATRRQLLPKTGGNNVDQMMNKREKE